jgi:hypothetical protein
MYEEVTDFPGAPKDTLPRKYVVLYQTKFEELLKTKNFTEGVRHEHELLPKGKTTPEVGDFVVRNYKLLQEYDPKGKGNCE